MRHLLAHIAMAIAVGSDDTSLSGAARSVEHLILFQFRLAWSMSVNLVPPVWVDVGKLVRRDSYYFAVFFVQFVDGKRHVALELMVCVPKASCCGKSWTGI